jgi:hypothetical protein
MTLEDGSATEKKKTGIYRRSKTPNCYKRMQCVFVLLYVPDTAFEMFISKDRHEVPRLVIRRITVCEKILSL